MKSKSLVLILVMGILSGCTLGELFYQNEENIPETPTPSPTVVPTSANSLQETADRVINALAEKDLRTLAHFVHPTLGVRFSPYTYVREQHQVFLPEELPDLLESNAVLTWGKYDGSGEPIELTFNDYYDSFIFSADFANPEQIGYDVEIGKSSLTNNIHDFYPNSQFVEYHFSGFEPQYEGMDWQSLRLVFVEKDGVWYLVGIVHDTWTI